MIGTEIKFTVTESDTAILYLRYCHKRLVE